MCEKQNQRNIESDEMEAFKELEEHIGKLPPDEVWALYFVSSGALRESVAAAVKKHISRGNKELIAEFPEFAHFYNP